MERVRIGLIKNLRRYLKLEIVLLVGNFLLMGCTDKPKYNSDKRYFSSVEIEEVFQCDCSIRAIDVDSETLFFAGSKGVYGYINLQSGMLSYLDSIEYNEGKPEFRAVARTTKKDYILSVDRPALLYEVDSTGKQNLTFKQDTQGTFYDALAFWNAEQGMMIGDPLEGCMAFEVTRDGGGSWNSVPCDKIGMVEEGEAAFAASNSNIAIIGDSTWILSGGQVSKVYFSPDKGRNWEVFDTPLIAGENTTGGYTVDFYDAKTGIIFGGDYTNPSGNSRNKAVTTDGGKTWQLIADGEEPGYKSNVKFVPGQGGTSGVAIGFTGVSYTHDSGKTWQELSKEGFYALQFLNDSTAYAAGKGRIAKLQFRREEKTENQ